MHLTLNLLRKGEECECKLTIISSIHSLLYAYPNQPKLAFQQDRDELCLLAEINIMVDMLPTVAVTFYVILKNKAQYKNNDAIIK